MTYRAASTTLRAIAVGFALAGCALAAPTVAGADVIATLSFDTPSATVANNVDIPVYVTLTLDPTSDPIITDASGLVTSPLSAQNIADLGSSDDVIINNGFVCSGNFTSGCGAGAYSFNFNFNAPSFVDPPNLDLEPGSSTQFLFGTFSPTGGHAPAGTYNFYDAVFEFEHFDPSTSTSSFSTIANTCAFDGSTCSFTRFVTASAPEPASWMTIMLGVAAAGGALRLSRRREALELVG
jgi:hypothetical protein